VNYIRVTCVTIGFGRFVRILENLLEMVEKGPLVSTCCKIGLCRLEELFFYQVSCTLLVNFYIIGFVGPSIMKPIACSPNQPLFFFGVGGGGRGCFQWPFCNHPNSCRW